MTGPSTAAAALDSSRREYERIKAEIDAAMVFAAAAGYHQQNHDIRLARTCVSDATSCYVKALGSFFKADLPTAEIHDLKSALMRLEAELKRLRKSRTHAAA
jgi:hypothetical protein